MEAIPLPYGVKQKHAELPIITISLWNDETLPSIKGCIACRIPDSGFRTFEGAKQHI